MTSLVRLNVKTGYQFAHQSGALAPTHCMLFDMAPRAPLDEELLVIV